MKSEESGSMAEGRESSVEKNGSRIAGRRASVVRAGVAVFVAGVVVAAALHAQTPAPPSTAATGQALPSDIIVTVPKAGATRWALALPPLLPPGGDFPAETASEINDTLAGDLDSVGVFALIPPASFPSHPGETLLPDAAPKWRETGADALLTGKLELSGGSVVLDARLWDAKSAKMIMGRRYRGSTSAARRISHTLANDILQYFTGRTGSFLTKLAFVSDRDGAKEIWTMDTDGRDQQRLTRDKALSLHPTWAPDGSALVYQSYAAGQPKLMKIPSGGASRVAIQTGLGLNASPAYSPDGLRIAFVGSNKKGQTAIFLIDSNGGSPHQLTPFRGVEAAPCWSPTGREIAFVSNRSGSPQIYVMDAEGANVRRLTWNGNFNDMPAWSPDGSRIAYSSRAAGDFNIAVLDVLTGEERILTDRGRNESPTWSPDGQRLAFSSQQSGKELVWVMNADGTGSKMLTNMGNNFSPSWSKSGT